MKNPTNTAVRFPHAGDPSPSIPATPSVLIDAAREALAQPGPGGEWPARFRLKSQRANRLTPELEWHDAVLWGVLRFHGYDGADFTALLAEAHRLAGALGIALPGWRMEQTARNIAAWCSDPANAAAMARQAKPAAWRVRRFESIAGRHRRQLAVMALWTRRGTTATALARMLGCAVRTIKGDVAWLRERGRLPASRRPQWKSGRAREALDRALARVHGVGPRAAARELAEETGRKFEACEKAVARARKRLLEPFVEPLRKPSRNLCLKPVLKRRYIPGKSLG